MKSLKEKIRRIISTGIIYVLGATAVNKIVSFLTNIFLVRILTKNDYGVFSSSFNIFLIAILFNGFGIGSSILFYASDKESKKDRESVYRFAINYGFLINTLISAGIAVYGLFFKVGIEETRQYIIGLSPLPIFYFVYDFYVHILRSRKENKKYSILLNINTITYCIFAVIGSKLWGIWGTIIGRYLSYVISIIVGHYYTEKFTHLKHAVPLGGKRRKDVVSYAVQSGLVAALNQVLYRIDITIISVLIADSIILANYKTGAVVPENMVFIPTSISIIIVPLFVEHNSDYDWIYSKAKALFTMMVVVCGCISIGLYAFADPIVHILWGNKYADSVPYFRILSISFFFLGAFRSTSTNILQSIGKVRYNLYVSIISGISNVILDVVMINRWGAEGAAYATLIVTIIASCLSFPYLIFELNKQKRKTMEHGKDY